MDEFKNKNILWIEDDIEDKRVEDFFGDLSAYVEWIKTFTDALNIITDEKFETQLTFQDFKLQHIDRKFSEYDLVVFDLNLQGAKDIEKVLKDDDVCYQKVANVFGKNGVILPDYDKFEEFKTECGSYLYLLLLRKGFPLERMIILTGNKNIALKLLKHNHLTTDVIIEKTSGKMISNSEYYGKNSSFYAVRRLVFSAADFWENKLKCLNDEDIAFNKLYFNSDSSSEERYTKDDFTALLNEVKLLFENMVPSDEESVYYHAMHIIASFHEEKADIKKLQSSLNLYPYHSMIRFFRNWSSHNMFEDNKLSADEFALLFCIALRTYFDESQVVAYKKKRAFSGKILDYEDLYFNHTINIKQQNYTELAEKVIWKVTIPFEFKIRIEINADNKDKEKDFAYALADKKLKENAKLLNILCILLWCDSSCSYTYKIADKIRNSGTVNLKSTEIENSECDKKFREVAAGLIAEILEREQKTMIAAGAK